MLQQGVGVVVVLLTLASASVAAEAPLPVSPGGQAGIAVVGGSCPTFHWTSVAGAESVDLVVYRLPEQEAEGPPQRVLSVTLPGSANGWTPSLGQCLEPGGHYAWAVAAGGEWSDASLFAVSAAPSIVEVEAAMAVLRRHVELGTMGEEVPGSAGEAGRGVLPEEKLLQTARVQRTEAGARPSHLAEPEPGDPSPTLGDASLTVDQQIHLGAGTSLFKEGDLLLWEDESNTAMGLRALDSNTTGPSNIAIGTDALTANEAGMRNVALGDRALALNVVGSSNIAIGHQSLFSNTASSNIGVGFQTLAGNTTGSNNIAISSLALRYNSVGSDNVAIGTEALRSTRSDKNTAIGTRALRSNFYGIRNVGIGYKALYVNTDAIRNVAVGSYALDANVGGHRNAAVGDLALSGNIGGYRNVAMGPAALYMNTAGNRNIAVGNRAGYSATIGDDNIFIGNQGLAGDAATIKIGTQGTHTTTYIAGIYTSLVGATSYVVTNSSGRVGLQVSSRRYKKEIEDLGNTSSRLLDLRPVSFRFDESSQGADQSLQFGLIAEEVAEVLPELVVYSDGHPRSVRYNLLSSLLVNELQKQHRQNQMQWGLLGLMLVGGVIVSRWRHG